MYKVYVIKSHKDNRIYIELTSNLKKRLKYHNTGKVFSTKGFRLWCVNYTEDCISRIEARKREKYFKSGVGKEFLKNIRE